MKIIGLLIVVIILSLAWLFTELENAPWYDEETNRYLTKEQFEKLENERYNKNKS